MGFQLMSIWAHLINDRLLLSNPCIGGKKSKLKKKYPETETNYVNKQC